jgi:ribonuclease P/MRP protein subunit POP3
MIMTGTTKPTTAISTVQETRLPIVRHLIVGINEVTKSLERQAKHTRRKLTVSDKGNITHADIQPFIKFVFVCRADIDPPLLVAHLPHLVAACNSYVRDHGSSGEFLDAVKVVPLPKGAELSLAEAIGFRRAAVLALDVSCKNDFDCAYRVHKCRAPHQIFPT